MPKVESEEHVRVVLEIAAENDGVLTEMKKLRRAPNEVFGVKKIVNQIAVGIAADERVTDAGHEIIVWSNLYH